MKRLIAGLIVAGLAGGGGYLMSTHPGPVAPSQCAVTLRADGTWSNASLSDPDALHYTCEEQP